MGRTDPSRTGAGAVPELVKGTACGRHRRTIGQMTESGKSLGGRKRAGRGWRVLPGRVRPGGPGGVARAAGVLIPVGGLSGEAIEDW